MHFCLVAERVAVLGKKMTLLEILTFLVDGSNRRHPLTRVSGPRWIRGTLCAGGLWNDSRSCAAKRTDQSERGGLACEERRMDATTDGGVWRTVFDVAPGCRSLRPKRSRRASVRDESEDASDNRPVVTLGSDI